MPSPKSYDMTTSFRARSHWAGDYRSNSQNLKYSGPPRQSRFGGSISQTASLDNGSHGTRKVDLKSLVTSRSSVLYSKSCA